MAAPDSGALHLENKAISGSVITETYDGTGSSALTNYPVANILDPIRGKRWRTAWSDSASTARIVIDLGAATAIDTIALIDCNVAAAKKFKVFAADDTAANDVSEVLTLWDASKIGNVHLFYLGSGMTGANYRYWAIEFNQSWGADYQLGTSTLEIGTLWLGAHTAIAPSIEAGVRFTDPSVRSQSYGGTTYVDTFDQFRELEFRVGALTHSESAELQESVIAAKATTVLVDLVANQSSKSSRNTGLMYGKLSGSGISSTQLNTNNNTVNLSMIEERR